MAAATPTVYGTNITGNQRQDWLNAKYILMWGWNPAEMRDGTNTEFFLRRARERGARIVCVDPRMTASAVSLADEWMPIRPGTDVAMMSAMAHVMLTEGLHDAAFVKTHCLGFDQTPDAGRAAEAESYKDYILGTRDSVPKTPRWAEADHRRPARHDCARGPRVRHAQTRACCTRATGCSGARTASRSVRAGCVLAAITGQRRRSRRVGRRHGLQAPDGGPLWNVFPTGANPVKASIPTFLWTEAVARPARVRPRARGCAAPNASTPASSSIWAVASNALVNQHANINGPRRSCATNGWSSSSSCRTTSSRRPRVSPTWCCPPARSSRPGAWRTDGSTATKCC